MRRTFDGANLFIGKHHGHIPGIPAPEDKEAPVTEELVHPHPVQQKEPVKPKEYIHVPQYNRLYGSDKVDGSWRYIIDNWSNGSVTTVAGSTVTAAVTLKNAPNWRLSQWPGAVQLYLCIRTFSFSGNFYSLATGGAVEVLFSDPSGYTVPLCNILNVSASANTSPTSLIPSPLTDGGNNTTIGNLLVTLVAGATTGPFNWSMGISGAYLLPQVEAYHDIPKGGEHAHSRSIHN